MEQGASASVHETEKFGRRSLMTQESDANLALCSL